MNVVRAAAPPHSLVDVVPFFQNVRPPGTRPDHRLLLSGEPPCARSPGRSMRAAPGLAPSRLAARRRHVRLRGEGTRTYYSLDWERLDVEFKGFLDYVEQRRSAPHPASETRSACAVAAKPASKQNAS